MSAHPQLSETDALEMVKYILSATGEQNSKEKHPVKGSYIMAIPEGDPGEGIYVVRAAYSDKGNQGIPSISAEKVLTLRNAKMAAGKAEIAENTMKYGTVIIASVSDSYIGFKNLDLTGIEKIAFTASAPQSQLNAAGGTIEIRLGSETGKLIGSVEVKRSSEPSSALMSAPITANIEAVTGFQDVYFVFKNENAPSGQSLFVVMDLEFQTAASASNTTAKSPVSEKQLSQKELQEFVGKYKVSGLPFEFLVTSIQGGKLQIQAGESKGIIRPSSIDDRFEGDNGTVLDFGRDPSNQVVKITMKTSGFEFEGKKQ